MERAFLKVLLLEIELEDKILGIARMEHIQTGWVVKTNLPTYRGEQGMAEAVHEASKTTGKIEGFRDGELELWNVIEVFDSEDQAIDEAKKNKQLFIFNIESHTFKWIV